MTERPPLHPLFPKLVAKPSYRIREIARGTGFSRMSIHRAIERGQLQALKIGPRTIRVPAPALRQFLETNFYDPFS